MNERGSAQKGVVAGTILIAVGVLLLMQRFEVLRFNVVDHFWPVVIALVGTNLVFSGRIAASRAMGVLLLVYAAIQELRIFDIVNLRFRDIWPVYLIALGVFLLWRTLRPQAENPDPENFNEPRLSEMAIFGGGEINVSSQAFQGGNLIAMFGGYEVDFTNSRLGQTPTVIYADAILGGITLKVPKTWRVTAQGTAVFGGFSNEALPPPETGEPEQHLVVKGMALLGGVQVSNPKR